MMDVILCAFAKEIGVALQIKGIAPDYQLCT
jgi:hypothetical protein